MRGIRLPEVKRARALGRGSLSGEREGGRVLSNRVRQAISAISTKIRVLRLT
jgi:hypothetical protein